MGASMSESQADDDYGLLKYEELANTNTEKTKLAWLILSGRSGPNDKIEKAVQLLEERVREGDAEALWMLALCRENGYGTKQEPYEAVDLFKKSSRKGSKTGAFLYTLDDNRWYGNLKIIKANSFGQFANVIPILVWKTLSISQTKLGDEGASMIANALNNHTKLTRVWLIDDGIGSLGATYISDLLKVNTTLTTLSLRKNSLLDKGAAAIGEALKTNSSLRELCLGENGIGDDGATKFSEGLKMNSTLLELDLTLNNVGEEGSKSLSEALLINTTLRVLDMTSNDRLDWSIIQRAWGSRCGDFLFSC